ncbi:hypothetical protein METBIDRAFT_46522 [Metschnikowia bicuspidata var. bicuspidata NRRL YB-4993]|uniref:B30.2/SPRY domain-containing protein n=1 Tax=Metschnikowia bicuspidata var. bicuspidata NRRL YB-4993 TaxID=869754 RepID=A0A1A0H614_9ASCO|nr:hypothetical protein METBIDRAFT_46522 [Metschnikowia bicuspidata var. bicuspidata NRRL YB-4993]OBA19347.1 hypothetical protein METBIDRAFT_46522 [Metschnikowia bicuspidata var. bicuspidata NRRL YB-4993]
MLSPKHALNHEENQLIPQTSKPEPDQRPILKTNKSELSELAIKKKQANVVVQPRLKPSVFAYDSIITEPVITSQHSVKDEAFFQFDDLPLNRRGYKYRVCKPNRALKATRYLTTELPPYKVRASYFDKSQGVGLTADMTSITTQNGWLSARCNVSMREGKYYFEYNIVNSNNGDDKAHVRVGIGRKELALDAPVGFDGYGYGLRDLNGQKITLSRPQEFMSEGFHTGDTIGFLVELPPLTRQRDGNSEFAKKFREKYPKSKKPTRAALNEEKEEKALNAFSNILRDQVAIKYKNGLFYEQFEYTRTKQMDHLLNPVTVFGETAVLEKKPDAQPPVPTIPDSRIVVYKNGQCVGEMFNELYSFLPLDTADDAASTEANTKQQQNPSYRNTDDGSLGYYPMMSVFQNGVVKINGGPDFKYAVPEGAQPLCKRYDEAVVEDWLWDLVDEVEAEYLDSFD